MHTTKTELTHTEHVPLLQTREDVKTALLVISLTLNLVIFTAWLVVTTGA